MQHNRRWEATRAGGTLVSDWMASMVAVSWLSSAPLSQMLQKATDFGCTAQSPCGGGAAGPKPAGGRLDPKTISFFFKGFEASSCLESLLSSGGVSPG